MAETFAVSWLEGWCSHPDWTTELDRAERWLAGGKRLGLVGQGAKDDWARMRFTLASYMLVALGDNCFYRYTRSDSYYASLWLYPEFTTAHARGALLAPWQEIRPGIGRRAFAHGYGEGDVAKHRRQLVLAPP